MLAFVQLDNFDLSPYEFSILGHLKRYMNLQTKVAQVGLKRLAKETHCAKNTAIKYLDKLVSKGIISKKTVYNKESKSYETNQYIFLCELNEQGVVHDNIKGGSQVGSQRDPFNNNYCCLEDAKEKLLKQFDINVVSEAIKRYLQTTDKINNLLNWLIGVCNNIVKQSINKKAKAPQNSSNGLKRAYTRQDKPKHWTKFHFECDRTGLYSEQELEQMLSGKKVPASIADASAILAKYQK